MSDAGLGHHHRHHAHPPTDDGASPVVAIVIERRHAGDEAILGTRAELERLGCGVQLVVPEPGALFDIPEAVPSWDAVVSRGRDPAVLALLAAAAALGVPAVNSPQAIDRVRNKVAMQAVLARHGMPLPRAWFAADPAAFRHVPREHFPLVVKPFDGDGSAGLGFLVRPEDATSVGRESGQSALYVAQEYLDTDGWDLKLYAVGSEVWAVRKPAPVRFDGPGPGAAAGRGEPHRVELDAGLRDIALTCGRACGLELWGVDVAVTPDGPVVMEVNDFPTYSAVPEAGAAIARHMLASSQLAALRRQTGQERMGSLLRSAP